RSAGARGARGCLCQGASAAFRRRFGRRPRSVRPGRSFARPRPAGAGARRFEPRARRAVRPDRAGAGNRRRRCGRRCGAGRAAAPDPARARGAGSREERPRRRRRRAGRGCADVIGRYPADLRGSLARFRLAAPATRDGLRDSAAALFRADVVAGGPQRTTARFWLGKLTLLAGDTAGARATWLALVREDSIGYYGLRARREVDLPPLRIAAAPPPGPSPAVATSLGRIDTLLLAGLDTAAQAEVRAVLGRAAQPAIDVLLAWSEGLAARGFGPAAVRLGWQAALKSPNDSRVLRVIFPWTNRRAVEAEAAEFGVDPLLLVAI